MRPVMSGNLFFIEFECDYYVSDVMKMMSLMMMMMMIDGVDADYDYEYNY